MYISMKVKVTQLCLTLFNSMNYTVHGILQGRILEWVAVLFSRGSSQLRDRIQVSSTAGKFFTSWATREAQNVFCLYYVACGILAPWAGIELGLLHWKLRVLTTGLPGKIIIPIVKGKLEEIFESLSDEKHIMVVFVNKIPSGLYYTQNVFLRKCLSKLLPWDNWVYDIITLMLNLLWLTK